ncbi:zinc ribbon domain-containing protein [Chryseobacterium sp. CH21]|uniref:zinc ribbon domain-containing protein n=1 Tax=Chryseobacterium sp. CH21 TaxID=713556 RepID=UPI00397744D9
MRGFLTCPKCGRNLTASGSKGSQKIYYYYLANHLVDLDKVLNLPIIFLLRN